MKRTTPPFRKLLGKLTPVAHGYVEITLLSWNSFVTNIGRLETNQFVWRGQRQSTWQLQSTLDRMMANAKLTRERAILYESAFKIDHLQRFKYASRGRRGPNPPKLQTDDEWWALGQHYGLATPLLDWTTSPFAAAFFAFEQEDGFKQTRYRAIWGLQTVKVLSAVARTFEADKREAAKIEKELRDQGIQRGDIAHSILWSKPQYQVGFVRPLSDENPRLVNQGGLFTKTPPEQTLDDWVKAHVPENERSFVLVKMLVPTRERLKVLRMLNRMNINQSTMFPDLGGAAQFCNMSAQIEGY